MKFWGVLTWNLNLQILIIIQLLSTSCNHSIKAKIPKDLPQLFNKSVKESVIGLAFNPKNGLCHTWSRNETMILDSKGNLVKGPTRKAIRQIDFSNDGTEAIFLYDGLLVNSRPRHGLKFKYAPWPAAISRDGKSIVYGDHEKLNIVRLTKDEPPFAFGKTGGRIAAAEFSPDGKYLAIGDEMTTDSVPSFFSLLNVWDWETRKLHFQGIGSTRSIAMLTFSPDGKHIATAGQDSEIQLWDVASHQVVREFSRVKCRRCDGTRVI